MPLLGHVDVKKQRVLSDNGPVTARNYSPLEATHRSKLLTDALGQISHEYTRPCRPQKNEKVERFHRTLVFELAHAHHSDSDAARSATYDAWIHTYNHHSPHTGIGGKSPIDRVHNINGKNSQLASSARGPSRNALQRW